MKNINLLAISGSLRKSSSNGAVINTLAGMLPANARLVLYDGMAGLPHFDPGLDTDSPPAAVTHLRQQIKEADGVLICTPEYAFGVPGSLKNALDWTVYSGEFVDKPVALITASSSGQHAHASLQLTLGAISAKLNDDAKLLISFVRSKINAEGQVTDAEVLASLRSVLQALIDMIDQS